MKEFSRIGFGSYRIDNRIEEHFNALSKALINGISLIDTSSNYSDGRSEILIGNVLDELTESGKIDRENITLVSKVGYMQGKNYSFALKKKEQGTPFNDVVEYDKELWHCISPDFLEDQLNRQLHRLDQNKPGGYIDAYLLHNPEYFLSNEHKYNFDKEESQQIYYQRIKKAFEFFEAKVKSGVIKYYGISSNTFGHKNMTYDFTSLEKILEIAKEISSHNHFKFIQLPFNLIESGAYFENNQLSNSKSVLKLAQENGIKVLVNRPLNAITSKGLIRLADFKFEEFNKSDFSKYADVAEMMEDDFSKETIYNLNLAEDEISFVRELMTFGKVIKNNWDKFGSIEHLNDIIELHFAGRLNALMDFFEEKITDDDLIKQFDKYIKLIFKLLNMITNYYREIANKRSEFLHKIINDYLNAQEQELTLSQKSILTLCSTKEVDCVLVGARKEIYVNDILPLLVMKDFKNPHKILERINEVINNESIN